MKLLARILLLFVLFTSVATAWDIDHCGQDTVSGLVCVAPGHHGGSPAGNLNDPCGHCGHLGSHMLGYVGPVQAAIPLLEHAWHGRHMVVASKPSPNFLFRPPRYSFVV